MRRLPGPSLPKSNTGDCDATVRQLFRSALTSSVAFTMSEGGNVPSSSTARSSLLRLRVSNNRPRTEAISRF